MARYNEIARRFKEALYDAYLTAKDLAERSGVGKSSISHYVNGSNCPSNKTAGLLASVLKVNPAWLMDLSDEKYLSAPDAAQGKAVRIPVLGKVAAGVPLEAIEEILDWEEIPSDMAARGEYFALKIKGDSMSPRIMDGDVVIVRQQPDVESGEVAIVKINGDEATCKRVLKQDNGITLVPFNPAYHPSAYSKKEIADIPILIVGKVVELRGKF